jgi:MFS family permease
MADHYSESWIMVVGFMINIPALALAWYLVTVNTTLMLVFFVFFAAGLGVGMSTNAALTLLRAVTDDSKMGRVGSAHLFARNQGFTFGAAIGGAVLLFVVTNQLGDVEVVRELISASEGVAPVGAAESVQAGFGASVAVGLVLSALGLVSVIGMRRSLTAARLAKRAA